MDSSDDASLNPASPPTISTPQQLPPPPKRNKKDTGKPRFRWTPEMVDMLIDILNDEKSKHEFKGLDFEADLVKLYSNIRKTMAEVYTSGEFGIVEVKEIEDGLNTNELALEKIRFETEKKGIRNGYDRIKTKSKEIRQNYRKAVGEGRRSGSGKIVCDNWDKLKAIWGGSPATTCIDNSISSISADDEIEWEYSDREREDDEISEGVCSQAVAAANPVNTEDNIATDTVNPTPKFVDNKRKNMEKGLSALQRDKVYMQMAKDELILKQTLVKQLTAATAESNKAFDKMSASIESVGKSIGEGLILLAGAIGNNQTSAVNPRPSTYAQNYYPQQYPHTTGSPYPNHLNLPYHDQNNNDANYEQL